MAPFWTNLNLAALNPLRRELGFVAVDIGSSSVKMVEAAEESDGYRLLHVGVLPLPATAIQNNVVADTDTVVKTIKSLIQASGIRSTKVICAVPGRAVIIKKIELPSQEEKELEANVEFEASNVIPENLENVNLDYQVLTNDGKKMDILLVAVKKEIINSYAEVIREAGLSPAIMDVDYFAMENMHEMNYEPNPAEVVGLIHIGARYTTINVLRDGYSSFTGDLVLGGEAFTESLMQSLQISYEQAEKLKVTGLLEGKKSPDLQTLFRSASESLVEEISRTLSLYGVVGTEEGVHRFYLSGGGARISGLCPLFAERLGVPTELAEPFRSFGLSKSIDRGYLADSALALAVGAGLAIRRPGDR